jgi:hypothetical protein
MMVCSPMLGHLNRYTFVPLSNSDRCSHQRKTSCTASKKNVEICCEKNIERVKTERGTIVRALKGIHVEKCH